MRLSEARNLYLESLNQRRLALNTITTHRECLKHFLDYAEGIKLDDAREATAEQLLAFRSWLSTRRKRDGELLSVRYQNTTMRIAGHLFRYLFEQERILVDITRHMPVLRAPRLLPRDILSKDQVMRLLKQPNLSTAEGFRDRTALEILYGCGLRGAELCKLTVYDPDMKERTIRVVQGKGRKDRLVPVGNVAGQYLEAYLNDVYPVLQKRRTSAQRQLTLLLMTTAILRKRFKQYCISADLPETLGVHSLRHTCATELLRSGASIRHVQELLGHSTIATTQIYTHIVIDDLQKAHKKTAPSEQRTAQSFTPFNRQTAAWRQEKPKKKPRKQN